MKVGDYVRTENGIDKVAGYRYEPEYENGYVVWFEKSDSGCRFTDENLPKSSPNIIDLIQVGDFVNYEQLNGGLVLNKKDDSIDTWSILPNSLKNEDIKSVITKEQLKNAMYEVGE